MFTPKICQLTRFLVCSHYPPVGSFGNLWVFCRLQSELHVSQVFLESQEAWAGERLLLRVIDSPIWIHQSATLTVPMSDSLRQTQTQQHMSQTVSDTSSDTKTDSIYRCKCKCVQTGTIQLGNRVPGQVEDLMEKQHIISKNYPLHLKFKTTKKCHNVVQSRGSCTL